MKLEDEKAVGFFVPLPIDLQNVLARLDELSRRPEFIVQRERGLTQALNPYLQNERIGRVLTPLPEEEELANLLLFCDFYPQDGQFTLIEQLRDIITEHIPDEERVWLDPLKHSHLDLLELMATPISNAPLTFRSLGDGMTVTLPYNDFSTELCVGQVLLTRVIRNPKQASTNEAIWAGCGLVLSSTEGKLLYDKTRAWERRVEMSSGELVLGEWQEFIKRFGHVLLWNYAEMRMAVLIDAVTHIRYRTSNGAPYLYAIALYDHHEYWLFTDGLSAMKELAADNSFLRAHPVNHATASSGVWVERADVGGGSAIMARLTLTSSQLIVECDSPDRLNDLKHQLARSFGFALHFRGETLTRPYSEISLEKLNEEQPVTRVVSEEEDRTLLHGFLEQAYLEWSDQPHHMLDGQTPRHAAARPASRDAVDRLIDEMEAYDPGLQRTGRRAYDYNVLRRHVGIDDKN